MYKCRVSGDVVALMSSNSLSGMKMMKLNTRAVSPVFGYTNSENSVREFLVVVF